MKWVTVMDSRTREQRVHKAAVRIKDTDAPDLQEPRRAVQWEEDHEPVRDERLARLDASKIALIEELETCETQNDRLKGYLCDYERIQKSDRARIAKMEADAAIESRRHDGEVLYWKQRLLNLFEVALEHADQRVKRTEHGSADRIQTAMREIRLIEDMVRLTHDARSPNVAQLAGRRCTLRLRALCKEAAYIPRPDSILAPLYRIYVEANFDDMPHDAAWDDVTLKLSTEALMAPPDPDLVRRIGVDLSSQPDTTVIAYVQRVKS